MENLTLETALQCLRDIEFGMGEDALQVVRDQWEEALPNLLHEIESAKVVEREDELYDISLFHVAVALCAEQREVRAFPALCRRVEQIGDQRIPYGFCGFRLPAAVAACGGHDVEALRALFDDAELSAKAREYAFVALVHLSRDGAWPLDGFEEWFAGVLRTRLGDLPQELAVALLVDGARLLPEPAGEAAESYFADNVVEDENIEWFRDVWEGRDKPEYDISWKLMPFESAADELELLLDANEIADEAAGAYDRISLLLGFPEQLLEILDDDAGTEPVELDSVGRNDRCPCGSGKKFKKCCMGKDFVQAAASRVSYQGTPIRAEHRYASDLMEAGYLHAEEGDVPAQLAAWISFVVELKKLVPESITDPIAVERKGFFLGTAALDDWIRDFCALIIHLFLEKESDLLFAVDVAECLVGRFSKVPTELRCRMLEVRGVLRYVSHGSKADAGLADLRNALALLPDDPEIRCFLAQFLVVRDGRGVEQAKEVLREGLMLKEHPSMSGMLANIERDYPAGEEVGNVEETME